MELVSTANAAQQLGISERSLRQLAKHARLTELRINSRVIRYRQIEIDSLKNGVATKLRAAPVKEVKWK